MDLRLYYERAGRGDPELLFVPGWCCDRTAFQPQFDHFAQKHAVTALDLRGCGRSDAPEAATEIRDFADDLAQFCRRGRDRAARRRRPQPRRDGRGRTGRAVSGVTACARPCRSGADPPAPETISSSMSPRSSSRAPTARTVRRLWVEDMGARDTAGALDRRPHVRGPIADRNGGDPRDQRVERAGAFASLCRPDPAASRGHSARDPTRFGCAS